jgi:hypothetical protein
MAVADYNTDPDLNTTISGINIAEGCPPSGINNAIRQMMADIKDKADSTDTAVTTLDTNAVKLSGAQTITGAKTFTSGIVAGTYPAMRMPTTSTAMQLWGGDSANSLAGAKVLLYGGTHDSNPGNFLVQAGDSSSYKQLLGKPDGTLTWDGKDIITNGGDQTVGGTKTFTSDVIISKNAARLNIVETAAANGAAGGYAGIFIRDKNALNLVRIMATTDTTATILSFSVQSPTSSADSRKTIQFRNAGTTYFFEPLSADNQISLGANGRRWKEVWAGTGTIQTSDERVKSSIASIPDNVLDAWGDVDWRQFQFNDAVAEKGTEKARLHTGLIAQHIDDVFTAHNLDASRYGLFCYDEWDATPEKRDSEGNLITEAQPAGDAYALRYEEALCIEAAYQRRRADRAEARITALEQRLNEMEQAIAALAGGAE